MIAARVQFQRRATRELPSAEDGDAG